jgi:hypothetical protein
MLNLSVLGNPKLSGQDGSSINHGETTVVRGINGMIIRRFGCDPVRATGGYIQARKYTSISTQMQPEGA